MLRRRPTSWITLAALAVAGLAAASPAQALPTCGSLGQPECVEAPPPGVELSLSAQENPYGLKPLKGRPSPTAPLWPRVRGHKPYGFNAVSAGDDGITNADEAMLHRETGASMARLRADWAMIQYHPNWAAGGRPWHYQSYLDEEYRELVRQGVRPLLSIIRTPRRFTSAADTHRNSDVPGCGTSDACWRAPRADALERLRTFATDLAKRYPLAAGVEVWNEPNLSNPFWGREAPDAEHYTAMLRTVYRSVKKVRPSWPVLGGALAPYRETTTDSAGTQRIAMRTFLRDMLDAGAADVMDAVAYHPYLGAYPWWHATTGAQQGSLFNTMLAADEAVVGAYADAGEKMEDRMVVTEFGASTTDGWTPELQRDWLMLQLWLWDVGHENLPLASRVDAAFIHRAVDDLDPVLPRQAGFGLVASKAADGSFSTKPAFCGLRQQFGGFADCPASVPAG